jgi:host factor-I protein
MSDFNTGLPSTRQIQTYIKDRQEVEIKLSTDDLIIGKIMWQDNHCLCLLDHYEQSTLVWMQAIVYLKAKA